MIESNDLAECMREPPRDVIDARSVSTSPTTPEQQIVVLLLDALQKLADTGQVDAACRIAGQACAALRRHDAKSEHRFNALLHRLVRKLESIGHGGAGE